MESDNPDGEKKNDSMPSPSGSANNNAISNNPKPNSVSEEDKQKYDYLSDFFVLESVKPGKPRTLFFKCQDVECNTVKAKSAQERACTSGGRHI